MKTKLKDVALVAAVATSIMSCLALWIGVPAIWIAIGAFLTFDLATILFLGSSGRPPRRRDFWSTFPT